jgi:hypothetical protein
MRRSGATAPRPAASPDEEAMMAVTSSPVGREAGRGLLTLANVITAVAPVCRRTRPGGRLRRLERAVAVRERHRGLGMDRGHHGGLGAAMSMVRRRQQQRTPAAPHQHPPADAADSTLTLRDRAIRYANQAVLPVMS